MPQMSSKSPRTMLKSASIERGHCYARVFSRGLEWKGKKPSIFMPRGVIEWLRMCLKEFRSRSRSRKTSKRAYSDSLHEDQEQGALIRNVGQKSRRYAVVLLVGSLWAASPRSATIRAPGTLMMTDEFLCQT